MPSKNSLTGGGNGYIFSDSILYNLLQQFGFYLQANPFQNTVKQFHQSITRV